MNGDAERGADLFRDSFQIEEIHVAAVSRPVLAGGAAGPREPERARFTLRREPGADLEQPHVASAVSSILSDRVDETGNQRRPQRVELAGQRVGDRDGRATV